MKGVCSAGCIVLKHRPLLCSRSHMWGAYTSRGSVPDHTHLLVLCYGDDGQLAQLQALLISDDWEACLAACMPQRKCGGSGKKRVAHDQLLATSSYILVQQKLTVVFGQSAIGKELEKVEGLSVLRCLELHQNCYVFQTFA
jgi:hypothetical protein